MCYILRSYSNDEQSIGSGGESRRFKIGKPWIPCLAENKRIWKEQAVRGIWNKILVRCLNSILRYWKKIFTIFWWKMIKFDLRLWIWIGINNCYTIVFVKYFVNLLWIPLNMKFSSWNIWDVCNEKNVFFHFSL